MKGAPKKGHRAQSDGAGGAGREPGAADWGTGSRRSSRDVGEHLFELLSERHPALARHLEEGVAVSIDGQIYQETLLEPIEPDSEVFLIPQIAGG